MASRLTLVFPTTIDRRNPCCGVDQCIRHERIQLDVTPNLSGYVGVGTIKVRDHKYDVNANLTVSGDQIGGNIKFYHQRRKITVDNNLSQQRTSFPQLPVFNEWAGLRLTGFGDTGILELSDGMVGTGGGGGGGGGGTGERNSQVQAVLEATALRSPFNTIISTEQTSFDLSGTDQTQWDANEPQTVTLVLPEGDEITTIQFTLDELTLSVRPGQTQIFGYLTTTTTRYLNIAAADPLIVQRSYSSNSTTSLYNSAFPWTNQWSLVDNLNPSISLINPGIMLPYLPTEDIIIIVTAKVIGSQD